MSSPDSREINLVRCLKCGKILMCSRYDTAALLEHIRTDHPEVDIVDTDTKQKRTFSTRPSKSSPKQQRNSQVDRSNGSSRPEDEILECQCSDEECEVEKCRPHNKKLNVSYENTEDEETGQQYVKDVDMTQYAVTSEILEKYPEIKECEYCPHNPNAQVVYTRRYRVNAPSPVSTRVLQQPFQHNLYCTSIEKWSPANGTIHCPKCGCNKRPLIKTRAQRFTHNECGACCLLSCWPFCFLPWLLPPQSQEYLHCANCKIFLGLYDRNTNCIQPNRVYTTIDRDDQRVVKDKNSLVNIKPTKLLELESPPASSAGDSAKSKHLPSILIDGKELPPETVARIQKLKKYSSLAGIDLDALTNPTDTPKQNNHKEKQDEAPSSANVSRQSVKHNV